MYIKKIFLGTIYVLQSFTFILMLAFLLIVNGLGFAFMFLTGVISDEIGVLYTDIIFPYICSIVTIFGFLSIFAVFYTTIFGCDYDTYQRADTSASMKSSKLIKKRKKQRIKRSTTNQNKQKQVSFEGPLKAEIHRPATKPRKIINSKELIANIDTLTVIEHLNSLKKQESKQEIKKKPGKNNNSQTSNPKPGTRKKQRKKKRQQKKKIQKK